MTQRELIRRFLSRTGSRYTATDLCRALNLERSAAREITLASLSGTLKKMCDAGELTRYEDFGPRGGYGYEIILEAR